MSRLNQQAIEASAQHAADCVNEKSLSSGIRWMFVGDYVDKIARFDLSLSVIVSCLTRIFLKEII